MYFHRIDTTDVDEARMISHNFEVRGSRLFTERGFRVPDKKAIERTDNHQYLGTVGIGWEPVQPSVLYDMAKHLIEATNGSIKGVVNLFDGAVIGISFKLAEREYVENDKMDINFLMLTAFNGMYGLSGSASTYRYETESLANISRNVFNLKHTKFISNRIEVVKRLLKYYNREITSFDTLMNRLVTRPMSDQAAVEWFRSLFPTPKTTRSNRILDNSVSTFIQKLRCQRQYQVQGVYGTSYGAWCALTEYVNHNRTVRVHNGRDEDEVRFQTINFGTGNTLIQKGIGKLTDFHFEMEEFLID